MIVTYKKKVRIRINTLITHNASEYGRCATSTNYSTCSSTNRAVPPQAVLPVQLPIPPIQPLVPPAQPVPTQPVHVPQLNWLHLNLNSQASQMKRTQI